MYPPRSKIGLPYLHILHVKFPSAWYFRLGVKCRAWSVSSWLATTIARGSSLWSIGCDSQVLRLPTRSFTNPSGPYVKACVVWWTVLRSLGGTYAPTTYRRFRPDVTVKITTFGTKLHAPSTSHPSLFLHTMVPPPYVGSPTTLPIPCSLNSVACGCPR